MQSDSTTTSVNENVPKIGKDISALKDGLRTAHGVIISTTVQLGTAPGAQELTSAVNTCAQADAGKLTANGDALGRIGDRVVTTYEAITKEFEKGASRSDAIVDAIPWQPSNG